MNNAPDEIGSCVSAAIESFAELAPHAHIRIFLGRMKHGFAFAAKPFFAVFHRSVAWRYTHGAKLVAVAAVFTKIGTYSERVIHPSILSPADKSYRARLPKSCA